MCVPSTLIQCFPHISPALQIQNKPKSAIKIHLKVLSDAVFIKSRRGTTQSLPSTHMRWHFSFFSSTYSCFSWCLCSVGHLQQKSTRSYFMTFSYYSHMRHTHWRICCLYMHVTQCMVNKAHSKLRHPLRQLSAALSLVHFSTCLALQYHSVHSVAKFTKPQRVWQNCLQKQKIKVEKPLQNQ